MQPNYSKLVLSKVFVEAAREVVQKPSSEWSPAFAKDEFEPCIRDDMLRAFSVGFTSGSLVCGISAPFIVATAKTDVESYENPQGRARMPEEKLQKRKKLIALATLGAPGLAVGSVLGGVCAVGGAIAGGCKKLFHKMAKA